MQVADLRSELRHARQELDAALARIPEERWQQAPDIGAWTAAEVLEHLHRVETGVTNAMRRSLEALDRDILGPWNPSAIDPSKLEGLVEGTGIESPDRTRPSGEIPASQARVLLRESRDGLLALLDDMAGHDVGAARFDHFVFGPLNLGEWVLFLAWHERRHAHQLNRIAAALEEVGR
jgi:hypothetical protein